MKAAHESPRSTEKQATDVQPAIVDYAPPKVDSNDDGLNVPRWLYWWLPPIPLFIAGSLVDPAGQLGSGMHAYTIRSGISASCYRAGILYIPAMAIFRMVRSILRRRRTRP